MLYKNLLIAPFALNTLNLPISVHASTHTIHASNEEYICNGASNDECNIYCDIEDPEDTLSFSCGNVGECYLDCQEKKCIAGTVNATSANNLYVSVSGRGCMKGSTVFTPSNGNATFTMTAKYGFYNMDIKAGDNAQNILIDCDADISNPKQDCKFMNINAETANYLEIIVANELTFENSYVMCPVNSSYKGPNEAPCIIDASNNGAIEEVYITAKQGYPKDVWVRYWGAKSINTLVVTCDKGKDTWPSQDTKVCLNTDNPTYDASVSPTVIPSVDPTNNPSIKPTSPTFDPTMNPSSNPTTVEPTANPTKTPTKQPTTPKPTLHANLAVPTPSPTFNEKEIVVETDTIYNEATTAQHSEPQHTLYRVDLVLIMISVFVSVLILCLFLCYWYRKEKYYKEALKDKKESLMNPGTDDENTVQMHIFKNNPYNNLMVINAAEVTQKFTASWNSDDACIVGSNTIQRRHGESISMDVFDLEIVDDINKEHTQGEEVGYLDEGIKKNEMSLLSTSNATDNLSIVDDIDMEFRTKCSAKNTLKGNEENSVDDNDPANDPEVMSDPQVIDGAMTKGFIE